MAVIVNKYVKPLIFIVLAFFGGIGFSAGVFLYSHVFSAEQLITSAVLIISIILTLQGIFTLIWMLYAWENPEDVDTHKSPKEFKTPQFSFTALVPAFNEEYVIGDTIRAIKNINYPENLKEVFILCRESDFKTIKSIKKTIQEIGQDNIKLVLLGSYFNNKPKALNFGLKKSNGDVICVFDAEDEPHSDIYNIINTLMVREDCDVVQSGVQLMNFKSHWFSVLNVMEYFLWFKSGLHFFSRFGHVTPLGGNTVFFKKEWLYGIGGWDSDCLTEDADIAIRITNAGAKLRVAYDEAHVTQEETPNSIVSFINQRTRWNQGFLQILLKGDWLKLPEFRQKTIMRYVLLSPLMQAFMFLYMPIGILFAFSAKLPVAVSLISFLPFYVFVLQQITFLVGLYVFTKSYKQKFTILTPLKFLIAFYPYQILLIVSSFRALYRTLARKNIWQKTLHTNSHRSVEGLLSLEKQYAS